MEFLDAEVMVDGVWKRIEFEDIRSGDRFRLLKGGVIRIEATAVNDPRPCDPPGNYEITGTDLK